MAPRAVGIARKPAAAEESQPAVELASVAQDDTPEPIPLVLSPLVAPYRKRGRVKLRIERLPRRARLSQGQNNGDGSWSLMLDELEDLQYLPPKGDETSVLCVRIVRVEGGDATTLALLDYALPLISRGEQAEDAPAAPSGAPQRRASDAELRQLRNELAKAQAALGVRESELAEARRAAESARSESSRQAVEAELAAARSAWQAEFDQRLTSLVNEKTENFEKSRESWRRETEAALARAEKEWRAAEAERLAAAEARWQEKSSGIVARSRAEADALRNDNAELGRLREKIDVLQSALRKAEGELAKARTDSSAAEDRALKSLAQSRAEADKLRGDNAELTRLRERVETLQSSLGKRESDLAKLRAELAESEERARKNLAHADAESQRGSDHELKRLRERLDRLQASLTTRDKELAQARADVVEAENRSRKDVEVALAKAEKSWKDEEEARLQAAEARWSARVAQSQTEMRDHVKDRDTELGRLRGDLERAQKALAERDSAIKDARGSADGALREARRSLEAALAKAEDEKNAIEARWQEQFAQAVGAVTAQLGRSEKALSEARAEIDALRGGDSEIERLRAEQADLKGSLARHENELRRTRDAVEDERERGKRETQEALARAESIWQSNEAARLIAAEKRWKEQSRDAMEQASAQAQRAEAALTKLHAQDEAFRNRNVEYQRTRDECAALRDALAQREKELAEARWTLIQTRERNFGDAEPGPAQKGDQIWSAETLQKLNRPIGVPRGRLFDPEGVFVESREEAAEKPARHIGRDLVLVMILAVLVVAGGIRFAPDSWWAAILPAPTKNAGEPVNPPQAATPAPQPSESPAPAPVETLVIRAGNLRSGPSKTAGAVATLPKGTRVIVIERHGNWVHVQAAAQDAGRKALEGWMFSTFLNDTAGTTTRQQSPAEPAPAEHARAERPPADQAPAEHVPAAQAPVDQAPADQAPAAARAPAAQAPADQAPADQTPADQAPSKSP